MVVLIATERRRTGSGWFPTAATGAGIDLIGAASHSTPSQNDAGRQRGMWSANDRLWVIDPGAGTLR